jgi:hypothetical protein
VRQEFVKLGQTVSQKFRFPVLKIFTSGFVVVGHNYSLTMILHGDKAHSGTALQVKKTSART